MLLNNMLLLALANIASLALAERPAAKSATPTAGEGHTRVFSMAAAPTSTEGMVPHYIGKGVVAHIPADVAANMTWHTKNSSIHAFPGNHTSGDLSKRGTIPPNTRVACDTLECEAGVYICSEENFKGSCYWQQAGGGACHKYPYTRSSSFGVDMGLQCALFQSDNCLWDQFTDITWPGLGPKGLYGMYTWWNTRPTSFKCRPCVGCIYGKAPDWTINS